jgi:hypothetical protein
MQSKFRTVLILLAVIATAGILNQQACIGFAANPVQTAVDFCFLFDCQNGALGGLVQFCSNVPGEPNFFVDCNAGLTQ